MNEFVSIVLKELDKKGMTRSELAAKAGVGRPYLYRVLNGEQTPSFDWAERVANVLGISIMFKTEKAR